MDPISFCSKHIYHYKMWYSRSKQQVLLINIVFAKKLHMKNS